MQLNPDAALNPVNEQELYRTKRHWFGIWQVYIAVVFAYIVGFFALLIGLPRSGIAITGQQTGMLWVIFALAGVVVFGFMMMARYIYWASELVVTPTAVTQNMQVGLFSRKVSRLDMEKVEDVTATQNGILQRMFGYGTLIVETAGEQDHFIFPFCPEPNTMAQQIHTARQAYNDRLVEVVQHQGMMPTMAQAQQPAAQAPQQAAVPQQQTAQMPQQGAEFMREQPAQDQSIQQPPVDQPPVNPDTTA